MNTTVHWYIVADTDGLRRLRLNHSQRDPQILKLRDEHIATPGGRSCRVFALRANRDRGFSFWNWMSLETRESRHE